VSQLRFEPNTFRTNWRSDYFTIYSVEWLNGWWIGKDLEGHDHVIIKVRSRYLPSGLKKITKTLSQDSWCPAGDSNRAPPECESRALPLQPTSSVIFSSFNDMTSIIVLSEQETRDLNVITITYPDAEMQHQISGYNCKCRSLFGNVTTKSTQRPFPYIIGILTK
jgi:hypothetical protein